MERSEIHQTQLAENHSEREAGDSADRRLPRPGTDPDNTARVTLDFLARHLNGDE